MVNTIVLFIAHVKSGDETGDFFKELDEEHEEVKMNFIETNDIPNITTIYTSPYRSTIELSKIIKEKYNIKSQINIENALYDVLDNERYDIHESHYYYNEHFIDKRPYIRGSLKRKDDTNSIKWWRKQKTYKKSIENISIDNKNSSIMVCNIKYNESDVDIISRIGPFIYKLMNKGGDDGVVGFVTHPALKKHIINYVKWYNKQEDNTVKLYVAKIETNTVIEWQDVSK
jgi:broad specificity phosphatase PhoE